MESFYLALQTPAFASPTDLIFTRLKLRNLIHNLIQQTPNLALTTTTHFLCCFDLPSF